MPEPLLPTPHSLWGSGVAALLAWLPFHTPLYSDPLGFYREPLRPALALPLLCNR